ncbi:hypothetical protein D3C76_1501290 [compost metagenome]
MANQRDIAGDGDGLVLHLQGLEGAFAGFDIGDEGFLVLDLAAGMAVGEVLGGQRLQFSNVLVQHRLGQVVDGLRHVLVPGSRCGGHVAAEQAQKTDQHFCFFHVVSLLLWGSGSTSTRLLIGHRTT